MLVLSRSEGERIDVFTASGVVSFSLERFSHLSSDRPRVQVGVTAPAECRVLRHELKPLPPTHDGHQAA